VHLELEADGGATIRLSRQELVQYYNLLNAFMAQTCWSDGRPVPEEITLPHLRQLHQLAVAIGRDDVLDPDA
jgi:hypothetical protein